MVLEVKRRYEPVGGSRSEWEQRAYDITVWKWDFPAWSQPVIGMTQYPADYVPGLLRCYINDHLVDLPMFDEALARTGWTRAQIRTVIQQ